MARHTIELELDDLEWWEARRDVGRPAGPDEMRAAAERALHNIGLAVVRWRAVGAGAETGEEDDAAAFGQPKDVRRVAGVRRNVRRGEPLLDPEEFAGGEEDDDGDGR